MCSSLCAQRLIPSLQRCRRSQLLRRTLRWAMTHSERILLMLGTTPKRTSTQLPHKRATWPQPEAFSGLLFFSFLADSYLSLIDTNSDPLLRTVADVAWPVRLHLLRDVACLLQSWCRRKTGAEMTKRARCTGVPGVLRRWEVVVNDVPSRESLGCGSSSSWGGGLTLMMRLWILGLSTSLLTGASASVHSMFVFQQEFL